MKPNVYTQPVKEESTHEYQLLCVCVRDDCNTLFSAINYVQRKTSLYVQVICVCVDNKRQTTSKTDNRKYSHSLDTSESTLNTLPEADTTATRGIYYRNKSKEEHQEGSNSNNSSRRKKEEKRR